MKTIRVGLTGLSRAGKTVFLTSAIHGLTEHTGEEFREFKNSGWQYVGNAANAPDATNIFPYRDRLKDFRKNPPCWPASTNKVSEYRIHITLKHSNGKRREAHIVFVDYPGERLTDVALLDTGYEEWSDECFESLLTPSEELSQPARDFVDCVRSMEADAKGRVPEHNRYAAQQTFGDYVLASRMAGRPVSPLEAAFNAIHEDKRPLAPFFPLEAVMRREMPKLARDMKSEYARYLSRSVKPFLHRIASCDHQIVLVDILDILRGELTKHTEVQEQLGKVLHCYRALNRGRFRTLMAMLPIVGKPLIGKVTFCATKSDHATQTDRSNLTHLLRDLLTKSALDVKFDFQKAGKIRFLPISAHRCTEDIETNHEGKPLIALAGRLRDESFNEKGIFFPGRVPQRWPVQEDNQVRKSCRFPDFLPRPLPAINDGHPLPNINMGQVLFSIVEDILR